MGPFLPRLTASRSAPCARLLTVMEPPSMPEQRLTIEEAPEALGGTSGGLSR